VTAHPAPGTDEATLQHLYLNQVLPLVRSMEGRLVLHASAVDVGGKTVLFLGLSGKGKSTLSTWFGVQGHAIISDDGVVFSKTPGDFRVEPGHRSVRLWADSLDALLDGQANAGVTTSFSDKSRIVEPDGIRFCDAPRPVAAVFHLDAPTEAVIELARMAPREAVAESLPHLYLLDDREKEVLSAHFDQLTSLCTQVPQYRLAYPRQFDMLDSVRARVLEAVQGGLA